MCDRLGEEPWVSPGDAQGSFFTANNMTFRVVEYQSGKFGAQVRTKIWPFWRNIDRGGDTWTDGYVYTRHATKFSEKHEAVTAINMFLAKCNSIKRTIPVDLINSEDVQTPLS